MMYLSKSFKTFPFIILTTLFILVNFSCTKDDKIPGEKPGELEKNLILDKSNHVLNYVIPQTEYDKFINESADYTYVTKKVYEYFNDDFDYIFILAAEDTHPQGAAYGRHRAVKRDVEGLGDNLFDKTARYGSDGRLMSVLYMPLVKYIRNGPFLHEIVHHWGNKGFIPSTVGSHWGYSSVGGQLGGFDMLVELGNNKYLGRLNGKDGFGTFANGGNSIAYSNTELYLMGLIPFSELKAIHVAVNPVNIDGVGKFSADDIHTYTPSDLVATHGERIPSFTNAKKSFKGLVVVISTEPVTDERMLLASNNIKNFAKKENPAGNSFNFWKATGGRAFFEVEIKDINFK